MGKGRDQDSTMFILFSDQLDLNKLFFAAHATPYNTLYIRLPLADSNIDVILILASKTFPGAICYPIVIFNAKQHQRFSCNKGFQLEQVKVQLTLLASILS